MSLGSARSWLGLVLLLWPGCSARPSVPAPTSHELYNRLLNVRCLAFHPEGLSLVGGRNQASGGGGDLVIWEEGGNGAMREVPAHTGSVVRVAFTPTALISAGYEGSVKSWNPSNWQGRALFEVPRCQAALQLGGSGPMLAVLRGEGRDTMKPKTAEVWIWDVESATSPGKFSASGATDLAFSPTGEVVATLMTDQKVQLWKREGSPLAQLDTQATCLDFSPDGKTLAVGGTDGVVQLWEVGSATLAASLPSLGQRVLSVRFSPDGKQLAYGSEGHLVLSAQGKVRWDAPVDGYSSPSVLAFSADGKKLASAGASRVLLWSDL